MKSFILLFAVSSLPNYGAVGTFALRDQSGKPFTEKNMEGKAWVIDFIFTRCGGPCPILTRRMKEIQDGLPAGAGLLSITVDPDHDTPEVLSEYAARFGADPDHWSFLTGKKEDVYRLIQNQLLNTAAKNPDAASVGESFIHSQRFVLVGPGGNIRGFYDGDDASTPRHIMRDLRTLQSSDDSVPRVNALLNMTSAFFLLSGYFFIRLKRVAAHKVSMGLAFLASSVFLVNYIRYHLTAGSVPFAGEGALRTLYFAILISHSILAVAVVPLALTTLYRALKGDFEAHKKIARWTFPIWLYVSVTGVVVYYMLYA